MDLVQGSGIYQSILYRCLAKAGDNSRLEELKRNMEPVKQFVDIQVQSSFILATDIEMEPVK